MADASSIDTVRSTADAPIVLWAVEGLCARLSAVLSYRLVALAEGRPLFVVWIPDRACEGHFLEHFAPLDGVTFIDASDTLAISAKAQVVKGTIDFHDAVRHDGGREASCFAALQPVDAVARAVEENMQVLGPSAVSVHIRRTDHFAMACDRVSPTCDADFDRFLCAPEHGEAPIYVATDNAATRERFNSRYAGRVQSSPAVSDSQPAAPDALRQTSLRAAVVDLLTCASCRVFKGSSYSSFSDVISLVRRVRGVAHVHDEHEPSGLWQLQRAPQARTLLERTEGWWASDKTHEPAAVELSEGSSREWVGGSGCSCGVVASGRDEAASPQLSRVSPLCPRCSLLLLGVANRVVSALAPSTAALQAAIDAADSAASEAAAPRASCAGDDAAARWLQSAAARALAQLVADGATISKEQAQRGLDQLCVALFSCGCVGSADPVQLATFLAVEARSLGASLVSALLVAVWAHASRSFAPILHALRAGGEGHVFQGKNLQESDGLLESDGWLDSWQRERLVPLRDGLCRTATLPGPFAVLCDAKASSECAGECDGVLLPAPDACCLRCWRCLAPVVCAGERCPTCIARYCSSECERQSRDTHGNICQLVLQAVQLDGAPIREQEQSPARAAAFAARCCLISETYYAWRSGCPGWRTTHLDRRASIWEDQSASLLWDALPGCMETRAALFGGMYANVEDD
jgi:hypothetical protein